MKDKMLSVILPVYNVEKYLDRCLQSLCCQLTDEIEVIIVNDGSTDGCGDICKNYYDQYTNVTYFQQDNLGVSSARNQGLELARGRYVSFIDPDDTISDTYIRDILHEISVDPDLVILKYIKVEDSKYIDGPYNSWKEGKIKLDDLNKSVAYLFLNEVWNKVFKRYLIQKHGVRFNPDMKIAEDICFVLDFLKYAESAVVAGGGNYYYYWLNENSTIRNVNPEQLKDLMKLYHKVLDFAEIKGLQDGSTNQPSDFVMKNLEELLTSDKYHRNDVVNQIRESALLEREKDYTRKGIYNNILFHWIYSLICNQYLRTKVYEMTLTIYCKIKG